MKTRMALLITSLVVSLSAGAASGDVAENLYDITVTTIDGEEITMRQFENKVLLIVNVASRCGFTKQYAGLQSLYAHTAQIRHHMCVYRTYRNEMKHKGNAETPEIFCFKGLPDAETWFGGF